MRALAQGLTDAQTAGVAFLFLWLNGLFVALVCLFVGVVKLCSAAWYKWWFSQVVEVGRERYAIFVVLPVVATLAGGAAAVGIDRLTGPKTEPGTVNGWYLLGFGMALAVVVGFWALRLLTRRSTTSLISEALNESRHVDQALAVVTRYLDETANDELVEGKWLASGDDGGGAHPRLHATVSPLLKSVVAAAVALGIGLAGVAFLVPSAGGIVYLITVLAALVIPLYAGATILERATKRPILTDYLERLRDKQRELASTQAQAPSAGAAPRALQATPEAASPVQHGTRHVDARLAGLLAGLGAAAGLIAWRVSNGRRSA